MESKGVNWNKCQMFGQQQRVGIRRQPIMKPEEEINRNK
jgi:ABC-type polar amino acid transport system ATPase subunit